MRSHPTQSPPPSWAVLLLYLILSIAYTYPLFFLGSQRLYGIQVDVARGIHFYWCAGQSGDLWFSNRVWPQLNAPFGWDVAGFVPQYLFYWLSVALSWVSPRGWTNAYMAASFPLAAFFFYQLAFKTTRSSGGSFLGGFLFAFSPWHLSKSHGYPDMAAIQWVPLYALLLVHFWERPTWKRALAAGLGFVWLFNFSYVIGYMTGLFSLLVAAVWVLSIRARNIPWREWPVKPLLVFGIVHLGALAGWFLNRVMVASSGGAGVGAAARVVQMPDFLKGTIPWFYLFMPTYYHPLWDQRIYDLMLKLRPDTWFLEDIVNPGYVVWVLAAVGFGIVIAERRHPRRAFWLGVAALGCLATWLCLSPKVGKIILPFPNILLYVLFPMFRFFARFGLLVSLFFTLLASLGFALLTQRLTPAKRSLALVLALGVAGFELYCPVTRHVADVSGVPNAYRWLKDAPKGIVAEYPLFSSHLKWEPSYLFWQTYHGQYLFNADYQGFGNLKLRLMAADFRKPGTVGILREVGVRYLLVHKSLFRTDGVSLGKLPRYLNGAKLSAEWPESAVYEIPPPGKR